MLEGKPTGQCGHMAIRSGRNRRGHVISLPTRFLKQIGVDQRPFSVCRQFEQQLPVFSKECISGNRI